MRPRKRSPSPPTPYVLRKLNGPPHRPQDLPPHPSRQELLKSAVTSFKGALMAGFRFVDRISGVSWMIGSKVARLLAHPAALALIAGFVLGTIGTEYIVQLS
jgi:hypothetical protein